METCTEHSGAYVTHMTPCKVTYDFEEPVRGPQVGRRKTGNTSTALQIELPNRVNTDSISLNKRPLNEKQRRIGQKDREAPEKIW